MMDKGRSAREQGGGSSYLCAGHGFGFDGGLGMRSCQVLGPRQVKREATATGWLTFHIDGAAESGGDSLDHGEAQPYARMTQTRLLGAIEGLEDMGKIFGRDAAAVILDRENDDAWLEPEVNLNRGACRAVLAGVFETPR